MTHSRRLALIGAAGAAVVLRLVLLLNFPGNYDTESYQVVLQILDRGGEVYTETPRYNYSPVWGNVLRASRAFASLLGLRLSVSIGLLLLAVDLSTAALLYRMGERARPGIGASGALLFLWNPVSVFISSWHGQFDNIALFFLVAAVALARLQRETGTVLALSVSLLVKHVAWFHPLLFALRRGVRHRFLAASVPYALFAAAFLPHLRAWPGIRDNVFKYGGLGGLYGTDVLLLIPSVPFWVPRAIFLAGSLAAVWLLRHVEIGRAALLLTLVTLILLPGIAPQYLVWPIALGALLPGIGYLVYTSVAALFLIGSSRGFAVTSSFLPGWYGPWWAALIWLLLELRQMRLSPTTAIPRAVGEGGS